MSCALPRPEALAATPWNCMAARATARLMWKPCAKTRLTAPQTSRYRFPPLSITWKPTSTSWRQRAAMLLRPAPTQAGFLQKKARRLTILPGMKWPRGACCRAAFGPWARRPMAFWTRARALSGKAAISQATPCAKALRFWAMRCAARARPRGRKPHSIKPPCGLRRQASAPMR